MIKNIEFKWNISKGIEAYLIYNVTEIIEIMAKGVLDDEYRSIGVTNDFLE